MYSMQYILYENSKKIGKVKASFIKKNLEDDNFINLN